MRIAEASIRELYDRLDVLSVLRDYLRLERKSGRYWGCCPFHQEKTPSFTVDPDRKLYYCFGCHKGGTVVDFVMEMDKLSYPEAMDLLARKSGVELVREGRDGGEAPEAASRREDLLVLYERIAGSFHYLLKETAEGEAARRYVLGRGISPETADRFRLGWAPRDRRWLFRFLTGKGYSGELLAASGLFSRNYPDSALFSGRLMFPIADRGGRPVAFGGRLLEGEGPKYVNSPETEIYRKGETLFALDAAVPEIRRTKAVWIAEGYMDVLALHQAGVGNAVAPLGTAFTDGQARTLRRWADTAQLLFDADEAGRAAAVKAVLACRRNGLAARAAVPGEALARALAESAAPPAEGTAPPAEGTAPPAEGTAPPAEGRGAKDPADILKDFGPELLRKSVEYSITDFEYLVQYAETHFDLTAPGGKAQAAAFLFPYAEVMDSEVARDACLEQIADAVGADRRDLLADFRRRGSAPRPGAAPGRGADPAPGPVATNYELFLLAAVFINHGLYARFRAQLPIGELEDPRAKELYVALEEWFRDEASAPGAGEGGAALPQELLGRVRDGSLRNYVLEQNAAGAFSENPGTLMADGIRRVRRERLSRRQKEIVAEMRNHGPPGPGRRGMDELLAEKVHLDEELKQLT